MTAAFADDQDRSTRCSSKCPVVPPRVQLERDCQLDPAKQNLRQDAQFCSSDRARLDRVRPCPKDPEQRPAYRVTLQIERVADRSTRRQKPLRGYLRFEPEHLSLAPSDRQMRILSTVIFALATRAMNLFPTVHAKRRAIRGKSISDDRLRLDRLAAKQLLPQFQSCTRVATFLHEDVENLTLVINSAPQVHALAADLADHLVAMPAR